MTEAAQPTRKPRVAILHYASAPTIGGVESTITSHAQLFADHGYPVKVLTGRGEPFDPRVPVTVISAAGSRSPEVLAVNAELARGEVTDRFHALAENLKNVLLRELEDADVLIVHNALSLHKNLALTAALREIAAGRRRRLIAWCHDFAWTDPQYAGDMHAGEPWEWLRQPWEGVQYVVVSKARRKELRALWGDAVTRSEIQVVPPGIDPFRFLGITEQAALWIRELGLLDAEALLLLPARLTRRKNVELAIEITAALCRHGTRAKLVITGPPGPHNPANAAYLERLRELRKKLGAEQAVILLHEYGAVYGAALRDLYLLADALVFPSQREGFGIPLLEAGLTRLPVFCTDLAPFRESARREAHYIRRTDSPDAAAELIEHVLARDRAYRFKRRVLAEYMWERIFRDRIEPLIAGGSANAG